MGRGYPRFPRDLPEGLWSSDARRDTVPWVSKQLHVRLSLMALKAARSPKRHGGGTVDLRGTLLFARFLVRNVTASLGVSFAVVMLLVVLPQ